jgi:hypothetical protein
VFLIAKEIIEEYAYCMSTLYNRLVQCRDAGIVFLDSRIPGWYKKFNSDALDALDVNKSGYCILAVSAGMNFWEAVAEFNIPHERISNYGFATFTNGHEDPELLADLWKQIIVKRQVVETPFYSLKLNPLLVPLV